MKITDRIAKIEAELQCGKNKRLSVKFYGPVDFDQSEAFKAGLPKVKNQLAVVFVNPPKSQED